MCTGSKHLEFTPASSRYCLTLLISSYADYFQSDSVHQHGPYSGMLMYSHKIELGVNHTVLGLSVCMPAIKSLFDVAAQQMKVCSGTIFLIQV